MTNMFKKSVLAIALAGISASAMAADLTPGTARELSKEFLATVPVVTAAGATQGQIADAADATASELSFDYEMGTNYAINDVVVLTFSTDAISLSTLPAEAGNGGVAGTDLVELSRISSSSADGKTVVTYRVTTADIATSGEVIAFAGIDILPRKLTGDVVVSYKAETSTGLVLDNTSTAGEATAELATVITQLESLAAEDFSTNVDVNEERKQFDAVPTGTFTVAQTAPADLAVTVTETVYTITGDFSWLLDEDGDVDTDIAAVAVNGGSTVEVEADQVVITRADLTAPTLTITPDAANTVVIPDQDFTITAEVTYEAGTAAEEGTKTFAAVSAGSWTLNGSKIQIPYMPYGAGITQVINLNNAGTQTGEITVEGFDRTGKKFGPVVVGQAAPGKQIALGEAIATAVTGVVGASERVSLTLVTNVPADDVTVYSAYNTGGNGARIVVNDSNGKSEK